VNEVAKHSSVASFDKASSASAISRAVQKGKFSRNLPLSSTSCSAFLVRAVLGCVDRESFVKVRITWLWMGRAAANHCKIQSVAGTESMVSGAEFTSKGNAVPIHIILSIIIG
jgi:hypothetical protein